MQIKFTIFLPNTSNTNSQFFMSNKIELWLLRCLGRWGCLIFKAVFTTVIIIDASVDASGSVQNPFEFWD